MVSGDAPALLVAVDVYVDASAYVPARFVWLHDKFAVALSVIVLDVIIQLRCSSSVATISRQLP
jgi:hypothetical protein